MIALLLYSRNGITPVLYDSPRIADDDRRERLHMKKYGIWRVVLQTISGEVVKRDVTAWSGKDARRRIEKLYEGCEILKMIRVSWLTGFSRAQLSEALFNFNPMYGQALLDILTDNGVFSSCEETSPKTVF